MNDYLQVLKNGMSNLSGISEGWYNEVKDGMNLLTEEQRQVIEYRLQKCAECPFNSVNALNTTSYKTTLDYYHCSSCKCPLSKKTKAFSDNCGLEYFMFNADDDSVKHIREYYMTHNEPIELKWKAVSL